MLLMLYRLIIKSPFIIYIKKNNIHLNSNILMDDINFFIFWYLEQVEYF